MSDIQLDTGLQGEVVMTVLRHLKKGEIQEATAHFAEGFQFNDWGIGLEFSDKRRLAEFFQKARELYPDSSLQTDMMLVRGNHVITQWTLHRVLAEPFYGGLSRKLPICLHGASIIRVENGKVREWSDYYDGLKSRRTALGAYFEEWLEL